MKANIQQAPIRNANTIGVSVYSHSGEFAPIYSDLELTGRGLDLQFMRSYRSSLANHVGELGRGWSASLTKKIQREGDAVIYHNGASETYKFLREREPNHTSPLGFYGTLVQGTEQFLLQQRYGRTLHFEVPERGGRIVRVGDRNQNAIRFSYSPKAIVITDTLERKILISVSEGLLKELKDHAGRTWQYIYDHDDRLIEVTQPATADFPNGTSVRYAYDTNHRLVSVIDAKGQQYLINHYDESGRVIAQEHGAGLFKMTYEETGEGQNEFPSYRTTWFRKNGSKLLLEHNSMGNVISRTLNVRKASFAEPDQNAATGDDVLLVTKSTYNKNSELTSRIFPAGNKTEWAYSEDEENALNQGNLSQFTEIPEAGVQSDQEKLVTRYESEPTFQRTTKHADSKGNETSYQYDDSGNLTAAIYPLVTIHPVNSDAPRPAVATRIQKDSYQYNSMGQLLSRTHIDGSLTEYYYYPASDPIGLRGLTIATNNPYKVCGYLARVVRDASGQRVKNEYAYDNFGNATTVFDGKGNPASLRYNAMGKVEAVVSRAPFEHRLDYKYDANYNEIESAESFARHEYDEANQTTIVRSSTLREVTEYDALNNVTLRKIIGDDKVISEHFIRDAAERIVRQVQPLGNATEYVYDERDLLITKQFGVGTRAACSNRYTYTLNDAVRTYTDGNGQTTTHHYDGFHRYRGFTNPVGTKKTQWFDAADNVIRVVIEGNKGIFERGPEIAEPALGPLMEANYHFDEWNRPYRVDKPWHNYSHPLGESKWDGDRGVVSTLLEYDEHGLPGKVWTETGNVVGLEYDGLSRLLRMKDLTGEEFSFEYDENSNPTLMKHLGPDVPGGQTQLDSAPNKKRASAQQPGGPVIRAGNGLLRAMLLKAGCCLSRCKETAARAILALAKNLSQRRGKFTVLARKVAGFLFTIWRYGAAFACGYVPERVLRRRYDEMDRLTWQQENDEAPERFAYNGLGNLTSYVGKSGIEIRFTDDSMGRRTGHAFTISDGLDETRIQRIARRFDYDDNYRLAAYTDATGKRTTYRYDSLDRQTEVVFPDGSAASFEYDANGNVVSFVDPNKTQITNYYDGSNRLVGRQSHVGKEDQARVEVYQYDGLSRMVAAFAPDSVMRRTYDSLSRLLTEQQGDRVLDFEHDSAGNPTSLMYPGGEEVHKAYDIRNRVNSVANKANETIASFVYGANDQITKMMLGNVIETNLTYNQQERLESIEYRTTADHKLLEGFRYQYDDSGRMTSEIELVAGPTYGERYYYDDANRATRAQYGVQNVFDPNSPFEQQTSYEHFPEGSWKRRIDTDGRGQIIEDQNGAINELNSYERFGNVPFAYDANGNCIRKGKSNSGHCDYMYDQYNRLIKAECYDAMGNRTQTLEYSYDALGQQVRKVVTDKSGVTTDYGYVWAGELLIEEYENGVLVRNYFYGIRSIPTQFVVNQNGRREFYYTHNGKGLASGLVNGRDPYAFAEKYGYELTGASFMNEIDGVKVAIPLRKSTNSSVANSILSGGYLRDWQNKTHSGIGGRQFSPEIGAMLNAGIGHHVGSGGNARGSLANMYPNMPGGSAGGGPSATGTHGGMPGMATTTNPGHNMSLVSDIGSDYVAAAEGEGATPSDYVTAPPSETGGGGSTPLDAPVIDRPPASLTPNESSGNSGSSGTGGIFGTGGSSGAGGGSATPFMRTYQFFKDHKVTRDTILDCIAPGRADCGSTPSTPTTRMVDPDSGWGSGGGPIELPSPQQIQAKLMWNKQPVNPNSGIGSPGIDTSSTRRPGVGDPTIALYEGPQGSGGVIAGGEEGFNLRLIGGGYTDTVQGWSPFTPQSGPSNGGRDDF